MKNLSEKLICFRLSYVVCFFFLFSSQFVLKICWFCLVLLNSGLLNHFCVWIWFSDAFIWPDITVMIDWA